MISSPKALLAFLWLLMPSRNYAKSIDTQLSTFSPGEGVTFKRVILTDGRRSIETEWGALYVEQADMLHAGFISVFGKVVEARKGPKKNGAAKRWGSSAPKLMVRNMRVNPDICGDLAPILRDHIEKKKELKPKGWTDPCATKTNPSTKATFFHIDHGKDAVELKVAVVLTAEPLREDDIRGNKLKGLPKHAFPLGVAILNFEYNEPDSTLSEASVGAIKPEFMRNSGQPRTEGEYDWYAQIAEPNVDAALSQCVPMAFANTLQFLDDFYSDFEVSQEHVWGVGDPSWHWPPANAPLVATLDWHMLRQPESGLNYKKAMRGLLSYLVTETFPFRNVEVIHQGGREDVYESYDEYNIPYGHLKSHRVGLYPTFEFMCGEIKRAHGVVLWYGKYEDIVNFGKDDSRYATEKRVGGHAVRIVGCGTIEKENRLEVIHDSEQGQNGNGGLVIWELRHIEYLDGDPYLNFNGLENREIELIVSIDRLPKGCDGD